MKNRYFFLIYLNDDVKKILDSMRIIADPLQKNNSHITVKGPYKTAQKAKLSDDNEIIKGQELSVIGVGNFFVGNQNTVFLKCEENKDLFEIWNSKSEKTYKEFHPHITIYDGKDRSFASKLFEIMSSYKINFNFTVEELTLYPSADKERSLLNLRKQVDYKFLSTIAEISLNQENVLNLTTEERLQIIDKLCKNLKENEEVIGRTFFFNNSKIKNNQTASIY